MKISGRFVAAGVSESLRLDDPTDVDITLSGTFVGTFQLERALTPDATAWERIRGPFTAEVARQRYTTRPNETLRWRCTDYTSGSATYLATTDLPEHRTNDTVRGYA